MLNLGDIAGLTVVAVVLIGTVAVRTEWLIEKLTCWPAEQRRHFAMACVKWSAAAMVVNVAAHQAGWIDEITLLVITLSLSWFALTVTFADIVIGTDVRVEVDT